MDNKVATIINTSLTMKTCDLLLEEYEKRSEVTKESHLKKLLDLEASFIKFEMLPVNQDTLDRVDITKWYRVNNVEEHKFLQKEFIKFLEE